MVAPPRPHARLCWLCERLLESYGSERRPHVREYIATAMRLGEPCQTVEEPKNTLQPKAKANGAKMKSIAPALAPGLGVGAAGRVAAVPAAQRVPRKDAAALSATTNLENNGRTVTQGGCAC